MTHTRTLLVGTFLVLALALSGCFSGPEEKGKSHSVDDKDFLLNKHLETTCTFKSTSAEGMDATLQGCDDGDIRAGAMEEAEIVFVDSAESPTKSGSKWSDRSMKVAASVYYPKNQGNDPLAEGFYTLPPKTDGTFTVTAKFPVDKGTGAYNLCYYITKQVETTKWYHISYQYRSVDKPAECVTFSIQKGGLF